MTVADRAADVTALHDLATALAPLLPRRFAIMHGGKEWHLATFDSTDGPSGPKTAWLTVDSDAQLAALLLRQYERIRNADGRRRPRTRRPAPE